MKSYGQYCPISRYGRSARRPMDDPHRPRPADGHESIQRVDPRQPGTVPGAAHPTPAPTRGSRGRRAARRRLVSADRVRPGPGADRVRPRRVGCPMGLRRTGRGRTRSRSPAVVAAPSTGHHRPPRPPIHRLRDVHRPSEPVLDRRRGGGLDLPRRPRLRSGRDPAHQPRVALSGISRPLFSHRRQSTRRHRGRRLHARAVRAFFHAFRQSPVAEIVAREAG